MFTTDAQTWIDLQLFPANKSDRSIFGLFNEVSSYRGKDLLDIMFRHPLSSQEEINARMDHIRYFNAGTIGEMKIEPEVLDFIEYYLALEKVPSRYSFVDGLRKFVGHFFKANNEYYVIQRGIKWLIEIVNNLYLFAKANNVSSTGGISALSSKIIGIVEKDDLNKLIQQKGKKLSIYEIEKFDYQLRYLKKEQIRELLDVIYQIDVYQAVAATMSKYNLEFAEVVDSTKVAIKGLFHPLLAKPVANDVCLDKEKNIAFITGANMAGKSTFMKAFGIAVYLAHMGFSVPVKQMELSICNGLYSTINVPDNLSLGYSHFYSEVQRIKFVAQQMDDSKKFIVLFDELFRGTNVKDAYDTTIAIIKAFSEVKNSMFMFSSHILEAAEELKDKLPNIQFKCFQTELVDDIPSYSYIMKNGISNDRFGMYIIKKEGILGMLKR